MGNESNRGIKKLKRGVVVKNAMNKSAVVNVVSMVLHPKIKKYYKKSTQFMIHDEKNELGIGDLVEIQESRPLSKRKNWRLAKVLEKAR